MEEDLINRIAGQRIRTMRKILGISQSELGSKINVTFQQIQKYEKGTNRMSIGTLLRICEALNTDASKLLAETSGKPDLTLLTELALNMESQKIKGKRSGEKFKFLQQLAALDDPAVCSSIIKLLEAVAEGKEKTIKVSN